MLAMYLLLMNIFSICSANVQNGLLNQDEYMDGDIVIVYDKMGLKMCGRHCMYQKSCTGFNYNEDTRICELLSLSGEEVSVPQPKSLYTDISTWNMGNDACHPNPCSGRERCVKTANGEYYCIPLSVPCNGVVCQHGGTCKNSISTFECRCVPGASGIYCEVTPCSPGPCLNGATCSFSENSYSCACVLGYYGTECQSNACDSNPCYNGGVCSPTGGSGFTCACATGWLGSTCEASVCDSTPCMYDGSCTPTGPTTYVCACHTGFSGLTCEASICDTAPCMYDGSCTPVVDGPTTHTCACHSGFSGLSCQVTPCDDGTNCWNSGTCIITGHTQGCNCLSGYSGTYCEVTPCTSPGCYNGGTCNIVGSGYTCSCTGGYYGTNCENTPCTDNPCKTGTCSITGSTYYCTCPSDLYIGTNCQYVYKGELMSLNYPSNYIHYLNVSYQLDSDSSSGNVRIKFEAFSTEYCCDIFEVHDGSNDSDPLIASFSGTSLPPEVISTGRYMFIRFITDFSIVSTGWYVKYYTLIV